MDKVSFILKNVALFSGTGESTVRELLSDPGTKISELARGETLCTRDSRNDCLIVILSGKAEVRKGSVLMRTLRAGDVTGVSTLFGGDAVMDTDVTAQTRLSALFIMRDAVSAAIKRDPALAFNYICFLSSRVRFLNGVISRCAGADSASKLARRLCELAPRDGSPFSFNASSAASELSMGRATLYRALSELEKSGFIEKNGKLITLKNVGKLKETYF